MAGTLLLRGTGQCRRSPFDLPRGAEHARSPTWPAGHLHVGATDVHRCPTRARAATTGWTTRSIGLDARGRWLVGVDMDMVFQPRGVLLPVRRPGADPRRRILRRHHRVRRAQRLRRGRALPAHPRPHPRRVALGHDRRRLASPTPTSGSSTSTGGPCASRQQPRSVARHPRRQRQPGGARRSVRRAGPGLDARGRSRWLTRKDDRRSPTCAPARSPYAARSTVGR